MPNKQIFCDCIERLLRESVFRENRFAVLAIDGMAASGKTTLALRVAERFAEGFLVRIVHTDDFFLPPSRCDREAGGNIHYEYFSKTVSPFLRGGEIVYRPYDCRVGGFSAEERLPFPAADSPFAVLTIVEGCYALHPKMGYTPDIAVFAEVDAEVQRKRILHRDGSEALERFLSLWIPKENEYFNIYDVRNKCQIHGEIL